jgi:hypothetical protein
MVEENGTYFVAMMLDLEDEGFEPDVFPVCFNTKDYREALRLTTCIAAGDPRKRVMFADTNQIFYGGESYD